MVRYISFLGEPSREYKLIIAMGRGIHLTIASIQKQNQMAIGPSVNYENESQWETGTGLFGTKRTQSQKTVWTSRHIWIRRTFVIHIPLLTN
jgi:hypothetical protein